MESITVSTKTELKQAKKDEVKEIIVVGKLATDLKASKKVTKLGPVALATLIAGIATIPATGGASIVGLKFAAPLAASSGLSVPIIIALASVGIILVLGIYKEYDEIEFDISKQRLVLRRKR